MSANSLASVIIGGGVVAASAAFYYLLNSKNSKNELVLSTTEFRKFPLIEKTILSHNSARYRFGLPNKDDILGLPTGQHISIMIEVDEKQVLRSYTPTSNDFDKGYFELVIKTYPTGVLSKHIDTLIVGDTISVRGPKGAFKYTPNMVKEFGMIAGGTGITPMFQVIKAILTNPADKTKVKLIYANVSEDDILLKEELDQLAKDHSEQFSIYYVLNNPPSEWDGGVGFVTKEMIEERFMKPSQNVKVLLCGPPPMIKAMSQYCEELSYDKPRALSKMEDMVFKF